MFNFVHFCVRPEFPSDNRSYVTQKTRKSQARTSNIVEEFDLLHTDRARVCSRCGQGVNRSSRRHAQYRHSRAGGGYSRAWNSATYESGGPSSAATRLFERRAWSNKKRLATVVSCSRVWTEPNGATCESIPRQSAAKPFKTSQRNILDAEANYL
jgi:hypothetical protein